ncbi:MAG: hydroxymethylbilane synthase [Proteobacteria bacterium]|nr:hydroxymethylbilane synthase [Pseudomonadota bacterium]
MSVKPLRIGTRASALALWQAHHVRDLLAVQPDAVPLEIVHIRTSGDLQTEVPLWQAGGRAFFTKEIDRALLEGSIDVAVHSLKDLATTLEEGIDLSAVLERADPRDAFLSRDGLPFAGLPAGARVGTSSLRRRAFLARARPDLTHAELRGNVPTRIERLNRGDYDAIILATAGVERLMLGAAITERMDPAVFPPAVSQGIVGVCTRSDDAATRARIGRLDVPSSRLAATAERALLKRIEGGCQVPLGALAFVRGEALHCSATVCTLDGRRDVRAQGQAAATLADAAALGIRLADDLLARGAGALIAHERSRLTGAAP